MLPIKCVTLGDGCAGKTSILRFYTDKYLLEEYPPTIYEEYLTECAGVDGVKLPLLLCDTAGLNTKPFDYGDTDIFLLCFSVEETNALENLKRRWLPEIRHYCPNVPVIVIATKIDLREHTRIQCITRDQGLALAKEVNALEYMECSTHNGMGIQEIFEFVASYTTKQRSNRDKNASHTKCCLM
uniref:Putative rho n=1 Tax=Haematobia irritans TaxID=7368 RepID=A0A1L8EH05_HAEIR